MEHSRRVEERKLIGDVKDSLAYGDNTVICSKKFKLNSDFKVDTQLIVSGKRCITRLSDGVTFKDEDGDFEDGKKIDSDGRLRYYLENGSLRHKTDEYVVEKSNGFKVRCEYIDANTGTVVYRKDGDILTDIENNDLASYMEHTAKYKDMYDLLRSHGASISSKVLESGVLNKKEREIPHIDDPEDDNNGPRFE